MDAATLIADLTRHYSGWVVVLCILTCFEIVNPREDDRLSARLTGIGFWAVSLIFSFAAMLLLHFGWQAVGVRPLFAIPAVSDIIGGPIVRTILAVLLGAAIQDFFFYWFHRFQHRFLWRWHAVHHSIERLNAVNSYHHPTEAFMSLLLMQIPMSLLIGMSDPASPIAGFLLWCHIVWIHSPTRATLGPLRAFIVDNRFHRIHHSVEQRHFDKNFGAFTTIWDRLFGTCHMPARDEWPVVGLAEARQPRGLIEWLRMPWRLAAPVEDARPAAEPEPSRDPVLA